MPGRNRLHVKFWGTAFQCGRRLRDSRVSDHSLGCGSREPAVSFRIRNWRRSDNIRFMPSQPVELPTAVTRDMSCPVVAASGNQANAFAVALEAHASCAQLRGQ